MTVTVGFTYPIQLQAVGKPVLTFASVETSTLSEAHLHFAFLIAQEHHQLIVVDFLPGFTPYQVQFGSAHKDLEVFVPAHSSEQMRELVFERLGSTVDVPVLSWPSA